jgi:predicted tellurium resistance membrane protein TerC
MAEIILFIVAIFFYISIPFLFLVPKMKKMLIKEIKKQSSVEELKQNIKWIKKCSIVYLILLGISLVWTYHYDTIWFVSLNLWWFLLVYVFIFYAFLLKSIIKKNEQEQEGKD